MSERRRLPDRPGSTDLITAGKSGDSSSLTLYYDTACRALAKARSVDEVKDILDVAVAMAAYARQAKNRDLVADAVEIQMRATRRLGELIEAQKETVGLNRGAAGGGKKTGPRGLLINPRDSRPTLASQGIDKNLAQQARVLGGMNIAAFERKVGDGRASAPRVFRRIVREVEIEQERAERRARTSVGGTVADLHTLIASGYRAGVIAVDPPWQFKPFSERFAHSVTDHYETMPLDEIKALPIRQLATKDCAIFLWCTWPFMPVWASVLDAWGVTFSGLAFDWVKLNPNGEGLRWGTGYTTHQNPEPCILARIGKPMRLSAGVHSVIPDSMITGPEVIMAPFRGHSVKPDEAYRRIQRLFGGPYLELFARKKRDGWTTWGDEIPREQMSGDEEYNAEKDFSGSIDDCYRAIRARKAAGGKGWTPP
jgi:N6-adenosine-specific RNA methylase IME4